jgi:hypothetical protein
LAGPWQAVAVLHEERPDALLEKLDAGTIRSRTSEFHETERQEEAEHRRAPFMTLLSASAEPESTAALAACGPRLPSGLETLLLGVEQQAVDTRFFHQRQDLGDALVRSALVGMDFHFEAGPNGGSTGRDDRGDLVEPVMLPVDENRTVLLHVDDQVLVESLREAARPRVSGSWTSCSLSFCVNCVAARKKTIKKIMMSIIGVTLICGSSRLACRRITRGLDRLR